MLVPYGAKVGTGLITIMLDSQSELLQIELPSRELARWSNIVAPSQLWSAKLAGAVSSLPGKPRISICAEIRPELEIDTVAH